jgi:DNA gyrase subunit A
MGRATQGVTLINVDDNSYLSGVRRIVESDVDDVELLEEGDKAPEVGPAGSQSDVAGDEDAGNDGDSAGNASTDAEDR